MPMVRYSAVEWQMNNKQSILDHVKQFHEKLQEVGIIHIPKETDPDFVTTEINFSNDYGQWRVLPFCKMLYKFPKGQNIVNFTEPDVDGVVEVTGFSPKNNYDIYLEIEWSIRIISYYGAQSPDNQGSVLYPRIKISREENMSNHMVFSPLLDIFSSWGTNVRTGVIKIETESIISLSYDGLTILHGMHTCDVGRNYMVGAPKNLVQCVINIGDDQTITAYHPASWDCGSHSSNGTLIGGYKSCYSVSMFKKSGLKETYTRAMNLTNFPYNNLSGSTTELQGLNCYTVDSRNVLSVVDNVYSFIRGNPDGESDFICYYKNKVVRRKAYFQQLNPMTPGLVETTSQTFTDYNREYGHIVEPAPLL